MKNTLIISFFGGPGSTKSTYTYDLSGYLKKLGLDIEPCLEYAKEIIFENSIDKLNNQIYIFGKQYHRIWRLVGKVDIVITDSPFLLSVIYDSKKSQNLKNLVIEEYKNLKTLNIFVERNDEMFQQNGRLQDLPESKEIDKEIKELLDENNIPYITIKAGITTVEDIYNKILKIK